MNFSRQDLKKAWFGINILMRSGECSSTEMKQLIAAEADFFENLLEPSIEKVDPLIVKKRRDDVEENGDMQEVLGLFWFAMNQEVGQDSNEVTMDGFIKFNLSIQRY